LDAATAINCYGYCTGSGDGIVANTANNCYGQSSSDAFFAAGLAARVANNCWGYDTNSFGIYVGNSAIGCYGDGYYGIVGTLLSPAVAIGCYGEGSGDGSVGIYIYLANSCYSSTGDGNIVNKYNMP
jgi:hypothetical protein